MRLDLDPARGGEGGLGLAGARGVVAVGEEHDPLLRVVGEQRAGQAEGAADVGRPADRRGGDPVDLGEVRWEALDQRVAAERDDPGHVLVLLGLAGSRAGTRAPPRAPPSRRSPRGRRRRRRRAGRPAGRAGTRPAPPPGATGARPGPRAPLAAGRLPSRRRDVRWRRTTTAMSGGSSSSASGWSKLMPIRRPVPPDVRHGPGPRPRARSARERVALVDQPLEGQHDQGDQHDRDPDLVAGVRPDGLAGRAGDRVTVLAEAGDRRRHRRARSVTRRRRAGRPRTAPGRPGRPGGTSARRPAAAPADPLAPGEAVPVGAAVGAGVGEPSGSAIRRHGVHAEQVRPGEGHAPGGRRRREQLVHAPVGPLHAHPDGARRDLERDRGAGRDRVGRGLGAAEELAGEVREQDRQRHLERQVGAPRLEGHHRGRPSRERPGVEQRRRARPRDDRARPGGQLDLLGLADVDRGQVDVAQDRIGRVEGPIPDWSASRSPRPAATTAAARRRGSAWAAAPAAGSPRR